MLTKAGLNFKQNEDFLMTDKAKRHTRVVTRTLRFDRFATHALSHACPLVVPIRITALSWHFLHQAVSHSGICLGSTVTTVTP